jgi:hypothetical protein
MDYEVIWTEESLCDVESIAKYIEKDSFFYASSAGNYLTILVHLEPPVTHWCFSLNTLD